VRAVELPAEQSERLVDLLVEEVLEGLSVSLARPNDGITEPAVLQRSNGASVYTVAGSDLFTSTRILDAEQRLVATAGRNDGHATSQAAVDVALLQATANGVTLNAGQAALVRQMATSGARLQLAIAPAGAGKTTAMQTLAAAWTEAGGNVIGLAPSAAAAAQLRDQINAHTDTLAKLTWSAVHHYLPDWMRSIGPSTLVVIDEAGMADTLTIDAAVEFIVGRGGSVRLVGDDQQLAAIGAGGVLRDIAHTHGAVRLTELHRFTDPAESAASLALRDGRPEALGFYLDQRRVHVGDLTALTEDVFAAWQTDRSNGLDSIMLAPTRELVSQLNQRARNHRLDTELNATEPVRVAMLADGNPASVGEQVITRANNRNLRMTASDWVKNGDRWTVLKITDRGGPTVRHHRNGRTVRLPASYVTESVELGYATTVHTAQGVTADTMHGLVAGEESRQQLYTMLTRGRIANHLYLQLVGDGDPHSLIRPETIHPSTATELLEQILARDATARSATTLQRDQHHPAVRLTDAAGHYIDALQVAAEDLAGREVVKALDVAAEKIVPGLTDEPAWPTLRAHLLLLAAHGTDPVAQLAAAAGSRELNSADDRAAVLDWRLDDTGHRNAGQGPLPWLPGIPQGLRDHPVWAAYLAARSDLVRTLANQIKATITDTDPPAWATQRGAIVPRSVIGEVSVWRAAMQVSPEDRRPTGPVQLQKAARTWQQHLDRQVAGDRSPALQEWGWLIDQLSPNLTQDPFAPMLADRLAAICRAGIDAGQLLRAAITAGGPLPDDHAAAAVSWRISRHPTPTVTAQADSHPTLTTAWTTRLAEHVGNDRSDTLQASRWWPALVTAVDHALQRGWRLNDLLGAARIPDAESVDAAQALVWRTSLLADPIPTDEPGEPPFSAAPLEPWNNAAPPSVETAFGDDITTRPADTTDAVYSGPADRDWVEPDLAVAALVRGVAGPPEQSDADVNRMFTRATAWQECPISRDRIIEINQMTLSYFRSQFPSSWGQAYLADRFGQDLTADLRFRPGQAPAGWTGLISHLRSRGVTSDEMTAAGVATIASTGRLIDRFRDRVVFPIIHNGEILAFVGRRHPDLTDTDRGGPKYLNTAETPLFHKGAQLFGANEVAGGVPVIVEGPMDAIAVTLASGGRYIGVTPLGTSLTAEQASQLARVCKNPIVATDADIAGRVAAERDFWILTSYRLDPRFAPLPEGCDPADLLALNGPEALTTVLDQARPLGERLVEERLASLPPEQARLEAARVVAARRPECWDQGGSTISSRLNVPLHAVRRTLLAHVTEWNIDSRRAAANPLHSVNEVKRRLAESAAIGPEQRWAALAGQLDQRLLRQGDWPALAQLLQSVDDQGHDVAALARAVTRTPLNDLPAQDLRYRLAAHLDLGDHLQRPPVDTSTTKTTTRPRPHREAAASFAAPTRTPPR
jgi:DNA primase catalytic core